MLTSRARRFLALRLLIKRFLGDAEGVHRCGHTAVEHHLRDDFGYLFLGYADVQRAGDVPLDHLRAVAQYDQGGDGAEAARFQVNGGPVVNLSVDHRIDEPHHIRGQLGHCRRGLGVVLRPIVTHSEVSGGLFQIYNPFSVLILGIQLVFRVRTIGT